MDYFLTISEAAEDDLRDAFHWYEEQKSGLGERFENHVNDCMQDALENPLKFQIRYSETHICFMKIFPYGIHFVVKGKEVLVVAVFHTSRNPKRWEKRGK
jgi:toxin ParE1/3/4